MSQTEPNSELTNLQIIARVWQGYLQRRKGGFAISLLLAAAGAGFAMWFGLLLKPAMDGIGTGTTLGVAGLLVVAALMRGVTQVAQGMMVNRLGTGLVSDVQKDLFSRMMRADLARLRGSHTGSFVSSVLWDATLIREAATNGAVNYTQQALTAAAFLAVMFMNDWVLAVAVMIVTPLIALMIRRFNKRSAKAARGVMAETAALSSALMEGLDGVRVVKIENREAYEEARIGQVIDRRQVHLVKGSDAKVQLAPATDLIGATLVAAALAYAGWRAMHGGMTAGNFTAFLFALVSSGNALRQIGNIQGVVAEGLTAARRLFGALDVEPEVREQAGSEPLIQAPGVLRFEAVGFAYANGVPVLGGMDLRVARGETIALVGPSGGGKSTALNLIPRFYDVTHGRVTLDGRDIRDVTLASLRGHIGLVTQEPFLFDDTVAANIAYARLGATDDEIEAAARAAAAHDFILALPEGYQTRVGEAGMRLSGGQRQRVAIARAFLKDAPILLLDEATSALDAESEAQVQLALDRLMSGRATILIAHRLATVRHVDRIYVLDEGRVVEEGDHDTLVAQGGLYARLARGQDLTAPAA